MLTRLKVSGFRNLVGVDEAYANGGQVDIHLGRFIAEQESRARASVTVIGADIEKGLFGTIDPIGKFFPAAPAPMPGVTCRVCTSSFDNPPPPHGAIDPSRTPRIPNHTVATPCAFTDAPTAETSHVSAPCM